MHHRSRLLRSAIRATLAPSAAVALALSCDRAPGLVIILDSTRLGDGVEVVAFPAGAAALLAAGDLPPAAADSVVRLRAADDSARILAERFAASRDSINRDVATLDTLDRRTRAYSLRYAELRRRTLAAERLRARRDGARARADSLRARLAARLAAATALDGSAGARGGRRVPAAATLEMRLSPGDWLLGLASPGAPPTSLIPVTVRDGVTDTVRLAPPPAGSAREDEREGVRPLTGGR